MNKQRIILFLLLSAALWGLPRRAAAQIFAVRANALAACSATLNVGAEAALTDNWSLELSGYWNPVQTASLSMNFHAVQLGGRYWFYESFVGHFLGQHLTYVGYDLGSRTKRYKGHACGLGVSYGYAWMLSKRWNVAVEAGAGLYRTKDTRRDPTVGDWDDLTGVFHDVACTSILFDTSNYPPFVNTTDFYRYAANPVRRIRE